MTNIATNTFAKLSVAFVTVAMLFTLVTPAQAITADELANMSTDELLALILELTTEDAGSSDMMSSCTEIPAPLTIGAQNANVTALQNFLIGAGEVIPAGATGYFGSQTQAALASWQAANGVSPAVGYYGPITKAAVDASCVPMMDDSSDDMMDDSDDDMSDDDDMMDDDDTELGNDEGEIENVSEVSADESNLEEGTLGGVLAFEVEIEGDVEINRMDVYAEVDDSASASDDADDYFTGASLWVDGEMIAELDVDEFDEDDYTGFVTNGGSDDQEFRLRFSGLDLVFEDGDEPEFEVAFEVDNSLDSDDLAGDWTVALDSIRFVDGVGFTDTYDASGDNVEETFGFDEEEVAELDISEASDNPDATTLKIEEDDEESDEYDVFVFEIEEENGVDVTIEDMRVVITTTGSTTESDVVDEAILYHGSDRLSAESVPDGGVIDFENLGIEIDGDATEEFTVALVFKGAEDHGNASDVTVQFNSVRDAEDERGNDEGDMSITGTPSSETHTLRTVVPEVSDTSFSVDKAENDESGVISFEFTISAEDDDYDFGIANKAIVDGSTDDIRFTLSGTDIAIGTSSITKVSGDAASTGAGFTIQDGDEATFVLDTTFTTMDSADNGTYRVTVESVGGIEIDETSEGMSLSQ